MENIITLNKIFESLEAIQEDLKIIKNISVSDLKWVSASDIALKKGLKTQSVIKQLKNGNFEPEVEYKLISNRMYVAKSAISKIKRMRR